MILFGPQCINALRLKLSDCYGQSISPNQAVVPDKIGRAVSRVGRLSPGQEAQHTQVLQWRSLSQEVSFLPS